MSKTISLHNEKVVNTGMITTNNKYMRSNRSQYLYFVDNKSYKFTLQRKKLLYQLKHTKRYRIKKKIQSRINKLIVKELACISNELNDKIYTYIK